MLGHQNKKVSLAVVVQQTVPNLSQTIHGRLRFTSLSGDLADNPADSVSFCVKLHRVARPRLGGFRRFRGPI